MLFMWSMGLAQSPERVFRGNITLDKLVLPIRMYLKPSGQNVSGYYVYEGRNLPIQLSGILSDAAIDLKEFSGNKQTGVFKGAYSDIGLQGDWYRPDGKMGGDFTLVEQDARFSKAKLTTALAVDKNSDINLLYPQFSGGQGAGWQTLNQMLRKQALGFVADIKQSTLEARKSDPKAQGGYLDGDYRLWLGTDRFISLGLSSDYYYAGAAHPNRELVGINFNPQTGKTIPLSSLFKKDSRYLERLIKLGKKSLEITLETQGISPEDQKDILETLTTDGLQWTLSPQSLQLYFGVAHVLGDYLEASIAIDGIQDILTPEMLRLLR